MRLVIVSFFTTLTLVAPLTCLVNGGFNGQDQVKLQSQREEPNQNEGSTNKLITEILDEINQRRAKEDQFIVSFLRQGPREQVRLWSKKRRSGLGPRIRELLIARHPDTAPYLAGIVRNGKGEDRTEALELLCEMDRFVPIEQLLFPELGGTRTKENTDIRGMLNHIMLVDGRRIGSEAYGALKWAAEQEKHRDLRFHARACMGLLAEDLRRLSLHELIKQWRESVIKSKGLLAVDYDAAELSAHIANTLIELAPESLPPLIDILSNDSNEYVQDEAIRVVSLIDSHRLRLRKSELGLRAIDAMRRALERNGLRPAYRSQQQREDYWRQISAQVFADQLIGGTRVSWSFYAFALRKLYGANTTVPDKSLYSMFPDANHQMHRFFTYLTDVDPAFPSWEYVYLGLPGGDVFHPQFRRKMDRYYEQWQHWERRLGR